VLQEYRKKSENKHQNYRGENERFRIPTEGENIRFGPEVLKNHTKWRGKQQQLEAFEPDVHAIRSRETYLNIDTCAVTSVRGSFLIGARRFSALFVQLANLCVECDGEPGKLLCLFLYVATLGIKFVALLVQ
jgi:hypothetical protein